MRILLSSNMLGRRRSGQQRMRLLDGITNSMDLIGWHHQLNGHECDQALGDGDVQGSLACCSPQGCKESDSTE